MSSVRKIIKVVVRSNPGLTRQELFEEVMAKIGKRGFYTEKELEAVVTALGKSTLYRLTAKRIVGFYKPHGKRIFFSRQQLERMLTKVRLKSVDEIESEILVNRGGNHGK